MPTTCTQKKVYCQTNNSLLNVNIIFFLKQFLPLLDSYYEERLHNLHTTSIQNSLTR